MIGYVRKFEGNTTMLFKIDDRKLLKRYNQIWEKVFFKYWLIYKTKHKVETQKYTINNNLYRKNYFN